jgi:c-di-GMP-binding flagellar brake protein YcgR
MQGLSKLEVGQAAEIEVPSDESSSRVRVLVDKVVDYEYVVVVPRADDRPSGLRAGAGVVVRFFTTSGRHQATSTIMQIGPENVLPLSLTLGKLENLRTVQQREYFRVFASLPLELGVVKSSIPELASKRDGLAKSVDISAGGLRVDTRLAAAIDDWLQVILRLPSDIRQGGLPDILMVEGRVVRCEPLGEERFRLALESRFAREVQRDKWVQLTLNLQRRKS